MGEPRPHMGSPVIRRLAIAAAAMLLLSTSALVLREPSAGPASELVRRGP